MNRILIQITVFASILIKLLALTAIGYLLVYCFNAGPQNVGDAIGTFFGAIREGWESQ